MPVKRRKAKARAVPITIEAVVAFKTAVALEAEGDRLDADGGTRHTYLDAVGKLFRLLNIPPWSMCPSDSALDGPMPDYMAKGTLCIAQTWEPIKALRAELMALAKEITR